jgi:hypothetical protein
VCFHGQNFKCLWLGLRLRKKRAAPEEKPLAQHPSLCFVIHDLQQKRQGFGFPGATKIAAAGVCFGLLLGLLLLTADPSLHRLIHTDADNAGHECAITLFAHGQVLHCLPELLSALVVLGFVWRVALPASLVPPVRAFVSPPGRGPPVFLP